MRLALEFATQADDAAIRGLVRRQPVPGRISITYQREPNFSIGCEVTGADPRILLARDQDTGKVVGVACRSERLVFVNGRERRLGYLGQLRVDQEYRGRFLVSRGFSMLREMHDRDPVPAYLCSIIGGNREATGVLVDKPRKRSPTFHPVADYCTLALRTGPRLSKSGPVIASAGVAEVAAFLQREGSRRQFFPVWTEAALNSHLAAHGLRAEDLFVARAGGEVVGTIGLWDQSDYKQSIVHGYAGWLKAFAPVYNVAAACIGQPRLPRPGEKIRSAYAAFVCVAGDDLTIFEALLRHVYDLAAQRSYEYLLLGLDAGDPLLPAARKYTHVLYPSRIYLAEWSDGSHLHEQLDERPAYVEIATL